MCNGLISRGCVGTVRCVLLCTIVYYTYLVYFLGKIILKQYFVQEVRSDFKKRGGGVVACCFRAKKPKNKITYFINIDTFLLSDIGVHHDNSGM